MNANPYRGEITARIGNSQLSMCLTLGALAELESAFAAGDLGELARRLSSGKLSAAQMIAVLGAGLRGGGHDIANDDVADMRFENGAAGVAEIVAELLVATFACVQADEQAESAPNPAPPQDK